MPAMFFGRAALLSAAGPKYFGTPEGIDLAAANNYRKLRYGAYRIIGVEKKVVLRPGETMEKVCRRTLGKDMIGYFEAINGQKRRSPGDTILVPKVELRPEYRK
mgnify:CR=1 FL=1